eukprot:4549950-Amphidinium_carterae.2
MQVVCVCVRCLGSSCNITYAMRGVFAPVKQFHITAGRGCLPQAGRPPTRERRAHTNHLTCHRAAPCNARAICRDCVEMVRRIFKLG